MSTQPKPRSAGFQPAVSPTESRRYSRLEVCATILLLLIAFVTLPSLRAQLSQRGVVKGFKLPEFYEPVPGKIPPNRLKTLVSGAEMEPQSKDLVAVKGMRIETYAVDGATNVIALAPQCMVELDHRQVSSTGRLDLVTGDGRMSLIGNEGFFCRLTNFNLIVSNHVRTVIRHAPVKTSKL